MTAETTRFPEQVWGGNLELESCHELCLDGAEWCFGSTKWGGGGPSAGVQELGVYEEREEIEEEMRD